MALGEWVSVRSSAEAFEKQMGIEADELAVMPEEEREELTLIYQSKGLSREDASGLATRIISNHETALDTLAREELGMSPDEVGNPWVASVTSFVTFAVGAILPILPWFLFGGWYGVAGSVLFSGLGLFMVGAATSLFTGRSVLFTGARMLLIGLAAAGITFGIGKIIGVNTNV
jgi:VIT1/CCC1 family predicted Fe2+/Mn2+ transporter